MKKYVFAVLLSTLLVSCKTMSMFKTPSTFIQKSPGWVSIQLKDGISFDQAWGAVLDVLAKRFEMEMISKEGGYLRTSWIYTWNTNGIYNNNYRVRVLVKFASNQRTVDVKTEAQYNRYQTAWVEGYDTQLLQTVKSDIMGAVGRTTM